MNLLLTLLWKEFHEHKWKTLSLCAIVMSLLIAGLVTAPEHPDIGLLAMLFGYLLIAPTYVAMGVSASEQSNRSIDFVRGLPIATWKVGMVRVFTGWVVLFIPLLCCLLSCLLWAAVTPPATNFSAQVGLPKHWSIPNVFLVMAGFGIAWCTVLYAWILATTMNQKTELRSGLIGLVVTVLLIWVGFSLVDDLRVPGSSVFQQFVLSSTPITGLLVLSSFEPISEITQSITYLCLMQFCWIGALITLAISRYGKESVLRNVFSRREPDGALPANRMLRLPIKSPRAALFWLQYRQSIPIALAGFVIVLFVAGIEQILNPNFNTRMIESIGPFIGCVLALIIGTGSFVHELEPQLYTFWRSRPISPRRWFWLKYLAGAVVIFGCYDLPLFALERMMAVPMPFLSSSLVPNPYSGTYSVVASELFSLLLHLFVYSGAVLAACSIRHPVYAPILAVCALLGVISGPDVIDSLHRLSFFEAISFLELWTDASGSHNFLEASAFIAVAFALYGIPAIATATFAGWLIKRDISVSI